MADVNLQLVREFFELNLFRVVTNWQRDPSWQSSGEGSVQLFVESIRPVPLGEASFVLSPADTALLERAVVEVRAWHADRFYPSVVESNPVLSQFVGDEQARAMAEDVFGGAPYKTLLVVSELPASPQPRARSIALLRRAGLDHVLEFPVLLQDLLDKVSIHGNYVASTTLQTLRLLKRYKLVRNMQLEFPFRAEPPVPETTPLVDTSTDDEE